MCDEIFDMVKPKNPKRITLEDLTASAVGETVYMYIYCLYVLFIGIGETVRV